MVYLDSQEQTLLFGGQGVTNALLGDTWTYSSRRWQRVLPGRNGPTPRCGHCLAYDEQAGIAVLFGGVDTKRNSLGDTWLFDGTSWKEATEMGPPARRYAALTYDPDLKGCVMHSGSEDEAGRRSFGDTWLFQSQTWRHLGQNFGTDPRDDHGFAYHRGAKRLVMLEGITGARGILVRETTAWRAVQARPLHPRHQCSPLARDDALGGLLLHGGEAHSRGPQFDQMLLLRMPAVS
jgi:hypothetical protein